MTDLIALSAAYPGLIWLAAAGALAILELATGSGWLLWPAGSAAFVGVALFFAPAGPLQSIGLFLVLTVGSTLMGRQLLHRGRPAAEAINAPEARLVGHKARVAGPFLHGQGRVFVDGKEWAAEIEGPAAPPIGAQVQVVAVIGGARLKVRELEHAAAA